MAVFLAIMAIFDEKIMKNFFAPQESQPKVLFFGYSYSFGRFPLPPDYHEMSEIWRKKFIIGSILNRQQPRRTMATVSKTRNTGYLKRPAGGVFSGFFVFPFLDRKNGPMIDLRRFYQRLDA